MLDEEEEIASPAAETNIFYPKWSKKVFNLPVHPDFDEHVGPSD